MIDFKELTRFYVYLNRDDKDFRSMINKFERFCYHGGMSLYSEIDYGDAKKSHISIEDKVYNKPKRGFNFKDITRRIEKLRK